ncbi:glycoside hydrolase family 32 protein [Salinibacter sp.]|uniref:glycoside hydrolase family 32 protein n=1 Tax=Salinibacter sp. TaxID=2065818 RepID=UPI0021E7BE23|nr:glycoside hydrolase family 32 protein [Salinibacter sp.]
MSFSFRSTLLPAVAASLLALFLTGCDGTNSEDSFSSNPSSPSTSFEEDYRPQFHYTPRKNWMNDPNGLVYSDGTFHLFHQYNPEGNTWGHMSWNQATSTDLVHWDHQGVAIPEEGNEMIFSGSAVVDSGNTSGFGDGDDAPLVSIYTSHYTLADDSIDQAQSLAYSTDGGESWTKYEGNPVLEHPDPDFRDPNVFWYEPGQKWIMTVALPTQHKVKFYESTDLKSWTHLSDFGPEGATEGIWECPALFRVPVKGTDRKRWVLQVDLNPGSVAGGSGGQYFLGDFDGTTFMSQEGHLESAPHWVDYGPDFYATIPWNNVPSEDGRALWLAWMNNWEYAEDIPTSPWRSAQSVARSVQIQSINGKPRLVQQPVKELQQLRENSVSLDEQTLEAGTMQLGDDGFSGRTLELMAEFEPGEAETVGLNVRVGENEETKIGYDAESGVVFVDRSDAGVDDFHQSFADRDEAPLMPQNGRIKLHVLVDRSSVEVFANDGARVLTHRIFPDSASDGVELFTEGGTAQLTRLDAWSLRSIWAAR